VHTRAREATRCGLGPCGGTFHKLPFCVEPTHHNISRATIDGVDRSKLGTSKFFRAAPGSVANHLPRVAVVTIPTFGALPKGESDIAPRFEKTKPISAMIYSARSLAQPPAYSVAMSLSLERSRPTETETAPSISAVLKDHRDIDR
jgi:hypothetical protein